MLCLLFFFALTTCNLLQMIEHFYRRISDGIRLFVVAFLYGYVLTTRMADVNYEIKRDFVIECDIIIYLLKPETEEKCCVADMLIIRV